MIFLVILLVIIFLDAYSFKGIRVLLANHHQQRLKKIIYISFWSVNICMVMLILAGLLFRTSTRDYKVLTWYYYLFGIFLVVYVPKILFVTFHFTEDILHGIKWIFAKLFIRKKAQDQNNTISRSRFLSQAGLILASVPFFEFVWGMAKGRFNFRVEHIQVSFPNLPKSFDGLRIIHISDIHIGSFRGLETHVSEAVEMINAQNADFIFFTGDLVNNFHEEMEGWVPVFSRMKAKYGIFSILGNHDYGDYYNWPSEAEKAENFRKIKEYQNQINFRLLDNKSVKLSHNSEEIALIGVENWGHPPFPQYADFERASKEVSHIPFKILLSHDPTYWDVKILRQTDVSLTLSGHTHGMQFGIRIGGKELWSPAQFMYKHWAGLYRDNNQFLYVNRGFGYIGYPGRVGMPPEITVLELKSS
jgi:uncharacterized protein